MKPRAASLVVVGALVASSGCGGRIDPATQTQEVGQSTAPSESDSDIVARSCAQACGHLYDTCGMRRASPSQAADCAPHCTARFTYPGWDAPPDAGARSDDASAYAACIEAIPCATILATAGTWGSPAENCGR